MKSLILAAGYATRLHPLTKNFPKPLLEIGGKSILDRLIEDLDCLDGLTQHIVVTNATFYPYFVAWKETGSYKHDLLIVNDGTNTNDTRLGAVQDIIYVLDSLKIEDDLLVLAGDNVVDFSFAPFVSYAKEKQCSCICCHEEPSISALQKTGVLEMDETFRVIAMHEKPLVPPSHWAVPPFYYYHRSDLTKIRESVKLGCAPDAPGGLVAWLSQRSEVYAWPMEGKRHDIGDIESYERIQTLYTKNGC